MTVPTAVVFDLGGVLIDWDPRHLYRTLFDDEVAHLPKEDWWPKLNPVQRQLLGAEGDGTGDHQWGHYPERTPLYGELRERGLLDPSFPPLIP